MVKVCALLFCFFENFIYFVTNVLQMWLYLMRAQIMCDNKTTNTGGLGLCRKKEHRFVLLKDAISYMNRKCIRLHIKG